MIDQGSSVIIFGDDTFYRGVDSRNTPSFLMMDRVNVNVHNLSMTDAPTGRYSGYAFVSISMCDQDNALRMLRAPSNQVQLAVIFGGLSDWRNGSGSVLSNYKDGLYELGYFAFLLGIPNIVIVSPIYCVRERDSIAASVSTSGNVATITTVDPIDITGKVWISGSTEPLVNVSAATPTIIDPYTFTYVMAGSPTPVSEGVNLVYELGPNPESDPALSVQLDQLRIGAADVVTLLQSRGNCIEINGTTLLPNNPDYYEMNGYQLNNTGTHLMTDNLVDKLQCLGIFPADYA